MHCFVYDAIEVTVSTDFIDRSLIWIVQSNMLKIDIILFIDQSSVKINFWIQFYDNYWYYQYCVVDKWVHVPRLLGYSPTAHFIQLIRSIFGLHREIQNNIINFSKMTLHRQNKKIPNPSKLIGRHWFLYKINRIFRLATVWHYLQR